MFGPQKLERSVKKPSLCDDFSAGLALRAPLKIHFGGQANLFDSGQRQAKATLASTKADLPSLPKTKNLHLTTQKQLLDNM